MTQPRKPKQDWKDLEIFVEPICPNPKCKSRSVRYRSRTNTFRCDKCSHVWPKEK
jgi:ribosomal protein L37AE/L43A